MDDSLILEEMPNDQIQVPKLKEALESLKRRQEEFNLQIEAARPLH